MNRLEFFMPMRPPTTTHQQHKVTFRNGKPVFYEPQELKNAREKLRAYLYPHRPEEPFKTAVELTAVWCFPVTGKHKTLEHKITKPDTDNLQKLLKDVMTECGFWKDDALVAIEHIEKIYHDIPGIAVAVNEICEI